MIVAVTLPWPPAILSPNARPTHWGQRHTAVKRARADAHMATKAAKPGPVPADKLLRICVLATPPITRRYDRDNMQGRLKATLDGIADALGIDDSRFVVWPIEFAPARRPGGVVVTVEAMP